MNDYSLKKCFYFPERGRRLLNELCNKYQNKKRQIILNYLFLFWYFSGLLLLT